LKRVDPVGRIAEGVVPPGLTAGGGLKRVRGFDVIFQQEVPPGLTAGGGLKRARPAGRGRVLPGFPPASPPGAD